MKNMVGILFLQVCLTAVVVRWVDLVVVTVTLKMMMIMVVVVVCNHTHAAEQKRKANIFSN